MFMRLNLLLLLICMAVTTHAQNDHPISLDFGDSAPLLRVREWIKGTPVQRFEKGKAYVVEFWATWCKPCIAAMPHLSALAREYNERITFLGINVYENIHKKETPSIEKVKAFVDSMGKQMDYHVAAEDSNFMATGWLYASGEEGIPTSFVVNAEGRIAWIGQIKELDDVLLQVVNNTWNVKEALAKRKEKRRIEELEFSARDVLNRYMGNANKYDYIGKPDSALLLINEMVTKEPKLKYAPRISSYTFSALLKTNPNKAYKYGKEVLKTPNYDYPPYEAIIYSVRYYSDKFILSAKIYRLAAKAYQARINKKPYPDASDYAKPYNKMAEWYWRANNKSKAIHAQQKAIKALKSTKEFSKKDMAAFKSRLWHYKNR